ncbi:MAG: NUDIX hydrolase [Bdellovibrionota bacterium]
MRPKKKLEEEIVKSELILKGNWLKVQRDEVRLPNGTLSFREYILHPGASLILPVLDDGRLVMIEQYRHPLKKVFLEFPAGKIDRGETSLQAAHRELKEEVGAESKNMKLMTQIHPVIGYGDEIIDLYLAKDLTFGEAQPDEGELLNIIEIDFPEAFQLLQQGKISDVKTAMALFWYEKILNFSW